MQITFFEFNFVTLLVFDSVNKHCTQVNFNFSYISFSNAVSKQFAARNPLRLNLARRGLVNLKFFRRSLRAKFVKTFLSGGSFFRSSPIRYRKYPFKNFEASWTRAARRRFVRFSTRKFQKKVGWLFFVRRRKAILGILNYFQSFVNDRVHTFLRFYAKEIATLRTYGKYAPFFYKIRPRRPEHSKIVWLKAKAFKRHYRWAVRKKFTIKQQVRYYKSKKFFPRFRRFQENFTLRQNYIMRRFGWASTLHYTLLLIRKLGYSFPQVNPIFTNRITLLIALAAKLRAAAFKPVRQAYLVLLIRKKKNNYYITLINGFGEVITSMSAGSYLLTTKDKKRNKKLRASFRYFMEFLKKYIMILKRKRIERIKYFFRPIGLRKKLVSLIVYNFLDRGITIENVKTVFTPRHAIKKKKAKARRL